MNKNPFKTFLCATKSMSGAICVALVALTCSCFKGSVPESTSGSAVKFFGNLSGENVPPQPIEPLTEQDAKRRTVYYEAVFDSAARVVELRKFENNSRSLSERYTYTENGAIVRQTTAADGSMKITKIAP